MRPADADRLNGSLSVKFKCNPGRCTWSDFSILGGPGPWSLLAYRSRFNGLVWYSGVAGDCIGRSRTRCVVGAGCFPWCIHIVHWFVLAYRCGLCWLPGMITICWLPGEYQMYCEFAKSHVLPRFSSVSCVESYLASCFSLVSIMQCGSGLEV